MSVLSKIFIVLLVVLVIAVSVTVVIVHREYQKPFKDLASTKQALETMRVATQADQTTSQTQIVALGKQVTDLQKDNMAKDATIAQLRNDVQTAGVQIDEKDKKLTAQDGELGRWRNTAMTETDARKKAETDLKAMKDNYEAAQKSYSSMNQKYLEVAAQRDFLLQQHKLLKEQIAILQEKINSGAAGKGASDNGEFRQTAANSGPIIKGKISAVTEDMKGATIDVGANDGVSPDMRFSVFRGDRYLGELVITRVDAKISVGRLEMVQDRVQVDDRAWNRLSTN
ncbi:MAG: hypothetical protein PHU85_04445 [Phycisphaerae bacterium]|nr:hypothetical protein [Phycisphaerae bacterium]